VPVELGEQPGRHRLHRSDPVHAKEQPSLAVDIEQRCGLVRVHLLPGADGRLGVVGPALDFCSPQ
jgi:hypothetical protein